MPQLLSDADVGFGAAPKLLSDTDVGFDPPPGPPSAGSVDEYGRSQTPMGEAPAASGAIARIAEAGVKGATEGFGNPIGQTILAPEAQDWLDAKQREGGVGGLLAKAGSTAAEDIGTAGGVLAGIPNAAFRGAQGVVAQTGAELGAPQLGRDIAAIPEAFMGQPYGLGNKPLAPSTITAREVQARDGVGIMEAWRRAHAENTAAPAKAIADIGAATTIDGAIEAFGKAAKASGDAIPTVTVTAPSLGGWGQLPGAVAAETGPAASVLTTASGKVPYRFEVMNAPDLTAASGDLQPRDRAGRMASSGQIVDMANNLDPELLHASPGPDQGAPTVTADGVVLAGNGRVAAIRQAHAMGNGDPYRSMVERVTGQDTSGMDAPVLIRRLEQNMTPEQQRQFAVDSNTPTGQRLSGTEQAALDARSLTPDLLDRYNPMLTGGPIAAGNRDFVRSWVGTLPQSERNAVMGADGAISADGVRRLSGAMLSKAYGDNRGILVRSLESTDDNARALTGALVDAAPAWAKLQAGITDGRIPQDMNVAPQLTRAIDLVRQAREKGQTVADVLSQTDAFNPIDPVTAAFVRSFYNPLMTRAASRPLVADVLRRYAVEASKTSTDAGLFGDAQPRVTPGDILAAVTASARKEPPVLPEPGAVAPVPETESVGAAASRQGTPAAQLAMDAQDFAANRYQGEVERLAAPPVIGDKNVYVPGTELSLAEITGDPVVASEHQYNRQQPAAAAFHTAREDKNGALVADYYADTAGSAQKLLSMERDRDALASRNIRNVFGAPEAARPPADPSPTLELMQQMRTDPRQAERASVIKVISELERRFFDEKGKLKTDPYALYGIGEHINDLLRGTGDTETSSAARVLKRELMQIKASLYNDIEGAAPGFAKYRADYQRDSQAIDAMKFLQDKRLDLLNNISHQITPAKWSGFMKDVVEGRADPMDPAASLSEDKMDRLWNITDHMKRQTLQDKGKPRGSWTSLMHEIGLRSVGRVVGHVASLATIPSHLGIGNIAVELLNSKMRERDVLKEMNRLLHPDLGQGPLP